MKPDTEIVDRAAFLRALANKPAKQARKAAGARNPPRATIDTATRSGAHSRDAPPGRLDGQGDRTKALERIAVYRFSVQFQPERGFFFWHCDGRTTTPHATYAAAVEAAERELGG